MGRTTNRWSGKLPGAPIAWLCVLTMVMSALVASAGDQSTKRLSSQNPDESASQNQQQRINSTRTAVAVAKASARAAAAAAAASRLHRPDAAAGNPAAAASHVEPSASNDTQSWLPVFQHPLAEVDPVWAAALAEEAATAPRSHAQMSAYLQEYFAAGAPRRNRATTQATLRQQWKQHIAGMRAQWAAALGTATLGTSPPGNDAPAVEHEGQRAQVEGLAAKIIAGIRIPETLNFTEPMAHPESPADQRRWELAWDGSCRSSRASLTADGPIRRRYLVMAPVGNDMEQIKL